jgi:hypothetical protein
VDQPVPSVTAADVARVIRRDFPAEKRAAVKDLLNQYKERCGPVPPPRVHLAVLKLSAGSVQKVAKYVQDAVVDYRDVLAWAEYPRYFARGGFDSDEEEQQVIDDDWAEYRGWLERE